MKCVRLNLQERSKTKTPVDNIMVSDGPRRFCQRRLVNPEHEEDPRWIAILDRFYCTSGMVYRSDQLNIARPHQDSDEMFLTVQTLSFQGDTLKEQIKRPKTSFKYKTVTDSNKHRMFVKHPVLENDYNEEDRSSQLTLYYFDDYINYLYNNDKSRPASTKSENGSANPTENKGTQVEVIRKYENKKQGKISKVKEVIKNCSETGTKEDFKNNDKTEVNTKITYAKSVKSKSITLSRTESPETVQVIRVDVVSNNTGSPPSHYENITKTENSTNTSERIMENVSLKNSHFANKYLLTNGIKTLGKNISGGAKNTLLCKHFKLSDRSELVRSRLTTDKKYYSPHQNIVNNENKFKSRKQVIQ